MANLEWDPTKYSEFKDFRARPFFDLVSQVLAESPRRVVDLGCGPGNLTVTQAQRWPQAQVRGVDSSPEMIAAAQPLTEAQPNLQFELADIAQWRPEPDDDVLLSNAALQWVPGHEQLLATWLPMLPQGAWCAIQVPGNFQAPSHALMRELAESPGWVDRVGGVLRHDDAVSEPGDYLDIFTAAGYQTSFWETTYYQVLTGENPVLEWVRGTGLRPVLQALSAEDAQEFENEYSALLREAYPARDYGTVFPFRRLFMVGQKG